MPGEARATELGTDSATLRRMVSGTRRRGGGRTQVMAISRWPLIRHPRLRLRSAYSDPLTSRSKLEEA